MKPKQGKPCFLCFLVISFRMIGVFAMNFITKRKFLIAMVLLISLIGIAVMVYPILSSKYADSVRSQIHTEYENELEEIDTSEIEALRESAIAYNKRLFTGQISPLTMKENGYYQELHMKTTKVMCYVSIPKIDVLLPVYHGIGNDALSIGAGHLPQSSLPIGGMNTHAVISAHTGMAKSPMFSDLELLKEGDIFQIQVLNETLTYEVHDINVVLPNAIESVRIQRDQDLVTLVTCTPYGVNSHRLLVTGHRIENPPEQELREIVDDREEADTSVWTDQYWRSVKIGIGIAAGIIVIFLISYFVISRFKKRGDGHGD